MSTVTITADEANASIKLAIVKTRTITRIVRSDANGVADVRTAGQLPSPNTPELLRTNLVTNPSFETGTAGWSIVLAGTLAAVAENPRYGAKVLRHSHTAGNVYMGPASPDTVCAAGQTFTYSVWVRPAADFPALSIVPYYLVNNKATGGRSRNAVHCPPNVWTRLTLTGSAPTGATRTWLGVTDMGMEIRTDAAQIDYDGALIERSEMLRDYFDGDMPDSPPFSFSWTGTAGASTSVFTLDDGQLIVTDYEAAAGQVSYSVIHDDGSAVAATAELHFPDGLPWLSLPTMPQFSEQLDSVTGYQADRESASTVHQPIGRSDPVVIFGPLRMRTGSLEIFARTHEVARTLQALMGRGGVVMLRQVEHAGLDMYFTATRVSVDPYSALGEQSRWRVSVAYTEVKNPPGDLAGDRGWTWNAVAAQFATWNDLPTAFDTWDALTLGDRR